MNSSLDPEAGMISDVEACLHQSHLWVRFWKCTV